MANPSTVESTPATAKPVAWITVRAVFAGTYPDPDSGRHFYRQPGELFTVKEKDFTAVWMVKADQPGGTPPQLAAEPPPTTLPTRPRPVSIGG